MERRQWLDDAVFDYIKNYPRADSVDIVLHFKLRADITMSSVAQLQEDKRISRQWFGFRYGYIITDRRGC